MRSTFHGLETAKRGMFSQQTAIQTTGHNIANANTKGYTRQTVDFVASRPIEAPGLSHSTAPGQLGTGVDFSQINRIREGFLDDQYRNQSKSYGDWTIRRDTLEKIETIVNEPSDQGIRTVIDKFWNSWHDLANHPDNLTARSVVMENGLALTDTMNDIAGKLNDLHSDIDESISIKVTEANTITKQIASLNQEIFRIEGLGDNANDLRDQRDLLTDNLSQLINIDVVKAHNGYRITSGSTELVSYKTSTPLDAEALPSDINGGEINGYLVSKDLADEFKGQLDQLVKGLVEGEFTLTVPAGTVLPEGTTITPADGTSPTTYTGNVAARTLDADTEVIIKGLNGLHQLGFTLQDPVQAGAAFFVTKDGSGNFEAGNLIVNPDIVNDVRNIAAATKTYEVAAGATTTEKVIKGSNELALWIGQLRNQTVTFNGTGNVAAGEGTIDEVFRTMVGKLGVKTQEAIRQVDNQKVMVDQVESRRQSVSGVSLDEEMANLIKFQHAYNASARMITSLDEMLDKIINGMGVVGR